MDRAAVRYDRAGDQHYDVISAFIKSIRGSDADAALHYLARMIEAGEDPRFIARRLIVHASEDVGMADPSALPVAVAAAQAVEFVGLPEARINLAQAVIHLALAPKSNAVIRAISAAQAGRPGRAGRAGARAPARRAATAARPGSGTAAATGTRTTTPRAWCRRHYAPDQVAGRRYYEPSRHGAEARYAERSERIRAILGRDGRRRAAARPRRPGPPGGRPGSAASSKPDPGRGARSATDRVGRVTDQAARRTAGRG